MSESQSAIQDEYTSLWNSSHDSTSLDVVGPESAGELLHNFYTLAIADRDDHIRAQALSVAQWALDNNAKRSVLNNTYGKFKSQWSVVESIWLGKSLYKTLCAHVIVCATDTVASAGTMLVDVDNLCFVNEIVQSYENDECPADADQFFMQLLYDDNLFLYTWKTLATRFEPIPYRQEIAMCAVSSENRDTSVIVWYRRMLFLMDLSFAVVGATSVSPSQFIAAQELVGHPHKFMSVYRIYYPDNEPCDAEKFYMLYVNDFRISVYNAMVLETINVIATKSITATEYVRCVTCGFHDRRSVHEGRCGKRGNVDFLASWIGHTAVALDVKLLLGMFEMPQKSRAAEYRVYVGPCLASMILCSIDDTASVLTVREAASEFYVDYMEKHRAAYVQYLYSRLLWSYARIPITPNVMFSAGKTGLLSIVDELTS